MKHLVGERMAGMTPVATSHTVLSRDGTRIGYLSVGSGPSVLVVPGVLSMAADYAAFARASSTTSESNEQRREVKRTLMAPVGTQNRLVLTGTLSAGYAFCLYPER